eukprot:EC713924.1.p1 GENE.EC713924.1~~EC713924.1.p1  ORF type:complete len:87 (+),score=1.43 EC713924.1:170-430(+)
MLVNEFAGTTFACTPAQQLPGGVCPIPDGATEIANFNMSQVSLWQNAVVLLAMLVGWRLLAYIAIRFVARPAFKSAGAIKPKEKSV